MAFPSKALHISHSNLENGFLKLVLHQNPSLSKGYLAIISSSLSQSMILISHLSFLFYLEKQGIKYWKKWEEVAI